MNPPSKQNPYPPIALEHLVFEGVLNSLRQAKKLDPSRTFSLSTRGLSNINEAATRALIKFYAETTPYPTQVGCSKAINMHRNYIKKYLWAPLDKMRSPW